MQVRLLEPMWGRAADGCHGPTRHTIEEHMGTESRYNFWSRTPGGNALLFNGRTGALLELESAEVPFARESLAGAQTALTPVLEQQGFLWPGGADSEADAVLGRRGRTGTSTPTFQVTISPTYGCNFRCTYCYVQFDDHRMSADVENRTLAFLAREIPLHPTTHVTWFGGEPLLEWRRVARMANLIQELGVTFQRRVEQFVTTNGYLLTERVAATLVEAGIRWFHVTIDGCSESQDQRRVLQNSGPTYDRVLRNFIQALRAHPSVGGTLRMNVEESSINLAPPLLSAIPPELRSRVQVHPTPIIRDEVHHDARFLVEVANLVTEALELGFAYYDNDIPVGRAFHCSAEGARNFQIGPDGILHKCSPSDKPEVSVATIGEYGQLEVNDRAAAWSAAHMPDPTCTTCEYLCFCQGGCRIDRLRHQRDPNCRDNYAAMPTHVMNRWLAASESGTCRGPV